jgi:peroxiredoxin
VSWLDVFLLRVGARAPDFSLSDTGGGQHGLQSLLDGRRALLVDFFYLACGPCVSAFPALERLQERHAAQGLAIATISRGDPPDALRRFADGRAGGITWLAAADDDPVFFAYRAWAYPTVYLIDSSGRIAFRCAGAGSGALQQALGRLGIGP